MWRASPTPAELLNQVWNSDSADIMALPTPSALDPALTDTLGHIYDQDDAQVPDPRFLDQLEQTLLERIAATTEMIPVVVTPQSHPIGRMAPSLPPALAGTTLPSGSWTLAHLATAALLLLTLVGSLVILGRSLRPLGQEEQPSIIPAIDNASELVPTTSGEATGDTVLMQATVDTLPPNAGWASLDQTIIPPGMEWAMDEDDGLGPLLYHVESGQLTITPDGPISVTRAGTNRAERVSPGSEAVLTAGDYGFNPSGVTSQWRNDGISPAIMVDARMTTVRTSVPPSGIASYPLIYLPVDLDAPFVAPETPFVFTVHRVTLKGTALLAVDAVPGLTLLYVESGQLEAHDPGDVQNEDDPLATPTRPKAFRVVNGTTATRSFPPGRIYRSADSYPVTVLLMTVSDANPLQAMPMS